jgi:hypothetical protein
MIAAVALAHDLPLYISNPANFADIDGLRVGQCRILSPDMETYRGETASVYPDMSPCRGDRRSYSPVGRSTWPPNCLRIAEISLPP